VAEQYSKEATMRTSKKILSVLALAFALAAPAVTADPGHGGNGKAKGKNKDKDKHSQTDRNHDKDRDRGWDDDEGDGQMRFQGMDRNGDRRISRNEWRGNDQSFANHDWNGDGILSGDEVRPGAQGEDGDWNGERGWEDRFESLDRNDDGYLYRDEWPGGDRLFSLLDLNRDGRVSFREVQEHYSQRR
jgi:Ca2+-binding EF-hand superfamily protein